MARELRSIVSSCYQTASRGHKYQTAFDSISHQLVDVGGGMLTGTEYVALELCDGLYCPCCGYKLRTGPRTLKLKTELRTRKETEKVNYQL